MNDQRRQKRPFDVVDLDPYGTAVPFLESAISAISNGGLLAVTFTDMAVLCARKPHVCFYKYGASPLPKKYCHEMALRIVLFTINSIANKYGKFIEPQLSLTVDFYVRLFIRVKDGAA
jgi:tRNA G26 N,N-dimethylase Trm1